MHANQYSIASPISKTYLTQIKGDQRKQLFSRYWKFTYGDPSNAMYNEYDDSSWDVIHLPHDYSLHLPYTPKAEAESGYKLGGVGWYRKSFTVDPSLKDKRIIVEFGGVYMNATVYINGHKLGDHPYGYTPFAYDLTEYIHKDGENILAVRVNHQTPSSRWYSGSGIYRNIYITVTDPVHVDHYGIKITTPKLAEQMNQTVDVNVETTVKNTTDQRTTIMIRQSLREKGSKEILTSVTGEKKEIQANESIDSMISLQVERPNLWSINHPSLYEVITEVLIDDEVVDQVVTDYGFRTIHFDKDTGFYLNQEPIKLKGVCMHHDQGPLGAAAHPRAIERQIEILKKMGANAIRTAHNPAAEEFIDLANKKGMLVIEEAFDTWIKNKNGNIHDYGSWYREEIGENPLLGNSGPEMTWAKFDLQTMVRRGINAPSIIMWSVGNEVMEGSSGSYTEYPDLIKELIEWVKEIDETRPTTIGENKLKANWKEAIEMAKRLADRDGIVGFNYASDADFDRFREKYPDWKVYGAETASSINSRGVYLPETYHNHLTSYDESVVGWGHLAAHSWYITITRDYNAGEFVWTGFDYLGEPTPWNNVGPGATGGWPSPKSSYFGIVDTAGIPKDRYYFYQSQWNEDITTLHLLPIWKEDRIPVDEQGNVRIDVFTNAKTVELIFVDEEGHETSFGKKSFTKKTTDAGYAYQIYEGEDRKEEEFRNLYLTWYIPYAKGKVYAKAYDETGELIADTDGRHEIATYKEPTSFQLSVDRQTILANGRDLSYILIEVLDEDGNIVEDADSLFQVSVEGAGTLKALDNGSQTDHEPYTSGKRKAFNGKLIAIIESTITPGDIYVNVEAKGLGKQSITLEAALDSERSTLEEVISYTIQKIHYVKLGHQPHLPTETVVEFADGREEMQLITWDIQQEQWNQPGIMQVTGTIEAYDLTVVIYVMIIDSIGGILNDSTAVKVGTEEVELPSTRPLILGDGRILPAEFPVKWDEQHPSLFAEKGIVSIEGKANVFGGTIPVEAAIRVDEAEVTLGDNIAPNYLRITEGSLKNPTDLAVLVDRFPNTAEHIWTNKENIQVGKDQTEIIVTYATAQFLGSLDIYFIENEEYAIPNTVELYWSNEGTEQAEWTKIDQIKSNEKAFEHGTIVNYRFSGIPAVGFKIVFSNENTVGISQIVLRAESSALTIHNEATIDELSINEVEIPEEQLAQQIIQIENKPREIKAISHKNAALTIVRESDDKVHILAESENHERRNHYTIQKKRR